MKSSSYLSLFELLNVDQAMNLADSVAEELFTEINKIEDEKIQCPSSTVNESLELNTEDKPQNEIYDVEVLSSILVQNPFEGNTADILIAQKHPSENSNHTLHRKQKFYEDDREMILGELRNCKTKEAMDERLQRRGLDFKSIRSWASKSKIDISDLESVHNQEPIDDTCVVLPWMQRNLKKAFSKDKKIKILETFNSCKTNEERDILFVQNKTTYPKIKRWARELNFKIFSIQPAQSKRSIDTVNSNDQSIQDFEATKKKKKTK